MADPEEAEVAVVAPERPRVQGERGRGEPAAEVQEERHQGQNGEPGGHAGAASGAVRRRRAAQGAIAARVIRLGAASRWYHSASRKASSMRSSGKVCETSRSKG